MSGSSNFSRQDSRLNIFATEQEVFRFTANLITQIVQTASGSQPKCNVIIAAGKSICKTLECLTPESTDWQRVNWFLADERSVDGDSDLRNDLQLRQVLLQTLGEKYGTVTSPQADIDVENAVKDYASRIGAISMFDFCLLGMGDDGHIASLFPGHPALLSNDSCCLITDSPNLPRTRISLGMKTLCNTKNRIVVTTGDSKNKAVHEFFLNQQTPMGLFDPTSIVLDQQAAK